MGTPGTGLTKGDGMLSGAVIVVADWLSVPCHVIDLASFRVWVRSPDFPDRGQVSYLHGQLWLDPGTERVIPNRIKHGIDTDLELVLRDEERGIYFSDRMLLTNVDADLSTEPDGHVHLE